jgi:hypothetical protein
VPWIASNTGIDVQRLKMSLNMLLRSAGKCKIITNAMPQSGGMRLKKAWKASMPPAEAPMPMMGKSLELMASAGRLSRSAPHPLISITY